MAREDSNGWLSEVIGRLSDEGSYGRLCHVASHEVELPSGEVLGEIIGLCRMILFPGYFERARINRKSVRFHVGVHVATLRRLLIEQIYAGLCFSEQGEGTDDALLRVRSEELAESFLKALPSIRDLLATDAEATFDGDPAATNLREVIFCYPGLRAIANYRVAHCLFQLGVPYIPRMITEMAHRETGIDIHPGAVIGHHFSIDHGTGTVIGETSEIGNHVRIFQGVSLAGAKLGPDANGNTIRGVRRHPVLADPSGVGRSRNGLFQFDLDRPDSRRRGGNRLRKRLVGRGCAGRRDGDSRGDCRAESVRQKDSQKA